MGKKNSTQAVDMDLRLKGLIHSMTSSQDMTQSLSGMIMLKMGQTGLWITETFNLNIAALVGNVLKSALKMADFGIWTTMEHPCR